MNQNEARAVGRKIVANLVIARQSLLIILSPGDLHRFYTFADAFADSHGRRVGILLSAGPAQGLA